MTPDRCNTALEEILEPVEELPASEELIALEDLPALEDLAILENHPLLSPEYLLNMPPAQEKKIAKEKKIVEQVNSSLLSSLNCTAMEENILTNNFFQWMHNYFFFSFILTVFF